MTIRKGDAWGEAMACPPDVPVVQSDSALRNWVVVHRQREATVPPVGVAAGDMARTCGGGGGSRPQSARVTVDVLRVTLDAGSPTWAVAHVVARRSWWHGEVVMAMNAQFFGNYDIVPRSHPNDGRVDVLSVDAAMSPRERWQARARARTGVHLPHPLLAVSSAGDVHLRFRHPLDVWADGERIGRASTLHVLVEPDALTLYV